MKHKDLVRVTRIKKTLDKLAYLSVALDLLVTLFSFILVKTSSAAAQTILLYVDYALSAEMLIIVFLFVVMLLISYYDRILDPFTLKHWKGYINHNKNAGKNKR